MCATMQCNAIRRNNLNRKANWNYDVDWSAVAVHGSSCAFRDENCQGIPYLHPRYLEEEKTSSESMPYDKEPNKARSPYLP